MCVAPYEQRRRNETEGQHDKEFEQVRDARFAPEIIDGFKYQRMCQEQKSLHDGDEQEHSRPFMVSLRLQILSVLLNDRGVATLGL